MNSLFKRIFTFLLIFSIYFGGNSIIFACGPESLNPLFSYTKRLNYPLENNFRGEIGIVPESYGRASLYIFYRRLNNLPVNDSEKNQITNVLRQRISNNAFVIDNGRKYLTEDERKLPENSGYAQWLNARAKVVSDKAEIETKKEIENYLYSENCLDNAFSTAAKTLEARLAKYGASEDVRSWLKGQDAVFVNCSQTGKLPENVSDSSAEWLKKDRDYQIAAALFYQPDFPKARAAFEKIAADKNSVWQQTAKFVVARTFIREASFLNENYPDYQTVLRKVEIPKSNYSSVSNSMGNSPPTSVSNSNSATVEERYEKVIVEPRKIIKTIEEKKAEKIQLLEKAETHLQTVLNDNAAQEFHESARRLLNYVYYRTNPDAQLKTLATRLSRPQNPNAYNDLRDYIWLLDSVESKAADAGRERDRREAEAKGEKYDYNYQTRLRDIEAKVLEDDLTDWLFAYQSADGFDRAFSNWQKSKNIAWLTAAISKVSGDSENAAELQNEAAKISANSPAYATVFYHQIRLLTEQNRLAEARQKLDKFIAADFSRMNRSTQNRFLSQRMFLAENLDEFLKFAQRKPETFVWSFDGNEEGDFVTDKEIGEWKNRAMFDVDSVNLINKKMPLSVMREAALSPQLPDHLKKSFVVAVWARAFILNNRAIENEFAPLMQKYAPEFSPSVSEYLKASDPIEKRAAQFLSILRNPIIDADVSFGPGRGNVEPNSIDSIRGNWWCYFEQDNEKREADFLTAAQKQEAAKEQRILKSNGQAATFLAREAVAFANKYPTNPAVPELLHLAIRATRYGCTDAQTLRFSKAAFDILHQRFPKNPWTAKTPYYFGNK